MEDTLDILKKLGVGYHDATKGGVEKNTLMYATSTGAGEELVPAEVLQREIMEVIPTYSLLLPELPGNHGMGMEKTVNKAIKGDVGFFKAGSEKTSGAFSVAAGSSTLATDEVQIVQKKYYMEIDISEELDTFNVQGAGALEAMLKDRIAKAAARTIDSVLLNGDTQTGSTLNVNSDDAAPAAGTYYLQADGLRKQALVTDTTIASDLGTFSIDDLFTLENILGDYMADPSQCMWLFNRATYNKCSALQAFYDASQRGEKSTLSGNALTNIRGADLFIMRDMGKTDADGKISSATPTKGQLGLLWKPTIQFGFGKGLQMKVYDFGKDGYQLQSWFHFGFALVQKKAGVTDSGFALGYNVTL